MNKSLSCVLWATVLLAAVATAVRAEDVPAAKPCCCEDVKKCCESKPCCDKEAPCCEVKGCCAAGKCCEVKVAACACKDDCCCAKGCACSKAKTAVVAPTVSSGFTFTGVCPACPAVPAKQVIISQPAMPAPAFTPVGQMKVAHPVPPTPAMPMPVTMPTPVRIPTTAADYAYPVPPPLPAPAMPMPVNVREVRKVETAKWCIQPTDADDKAALQIRHADLTEMTCDKTTLTVADQALTLMVVGKQVKIDSPSLKATANKVTRGASKDEVVLEGDVKLAYSKTGQSVDMKAAQVVVNLADGSIKMQGAAPTAAKQVFNFYIGLFD